MDTESSEKLAIKITTHTLLGLVAVLTPATGAAAQQRSPFSIVSTTVGVRTNLLCNSRLPTVFSTRPDGSGCIAYTDTKGNTRVFTVNRQFKKVSSETVLAAQRFIGLQANADGSFAVLTSTEEGSTEFRPNWCFGDNTLWATKVDAKGKTLWRTHLLGGKGYGPQQKWFISESAGVLAHNGSVYGAFYSVGKNFATAGKAPNPHEGDEFKAFDEEGEIQDDQSCTWNCSHSIDQRMIVDGDEFLTLTMGDVYPLGVYYKSHPSRRHGVVWPPKARVDALQKSHKKIFFPGNVGGIALMGDGVAGLATTFLRDGVQPAINSAERHVLFLRFDKSGSIVTKRYLTSKPEMRGLDAYIGPFGDKALVGWSVHGKKETTFAVMNDDGSYAVEPWKARQALGSRAGFVSMPNGDLVWVYARSGSRKVVLKRAVLPKYLRGATVSSPIIPATTTAKTPVKAEPKKVPPKPEGKTEEIITHYASGAVRTRYSIDAKQVRTGWSQRYYRSGQLKVRAKYAGGVPWGRREEFYANGKLKVSTTFVDGRQHGDRIEYDAEGRVTLRQTYHDGEPAKE